MKLESILHAILFSADRPLSISELANLVREGSKTSEPTENDFSKIKEAETAAALQDLKIALNNTPVHLQEIAGGWRLGTSTDYVPWIEALCQKLGKARPVRLSLPALETLAVIAYRQPISRSEIESIRGVAVGGVLETLQEREIIRIAGRSEAPGRPLLYETTHRFLEHFGLRSLDELPNADELKRAQLTENPSPQPASITPPDEPQKETEKNEEEG